MIIRHTLAAVITAVALLATTGCAVTRGQESVGAYVDDAAITTAVKARFVENKLVDAVSISVETLLRLVSLIPKPLIPRCSFQRVMMES